MARSRVCCSPRAQNFLRWGEQAVALWRCGWRWRCAAPALTHSTRTRSTLNALKTLAHRDDRQQAHCLYAAHMLTYIETEKHSPVALCALLYVTPAHHTNTYTRNTFTQSRMQQTFYTSELYVGTTNALRTRRHGLALGVLLLVDRDRGGGWGGERCDGHDPMHGQNARSRDEDR